MEAIKYVESRGDYDAIGKLGEIGAYQFMQATWKYYQLKYFGKVNGPTKDILSTIGLLLLATSIIMNYV